MEALQPRLDTFLKLPTMNSFVLLTIGNGEIYLGKEVSELFIGGFGRILQ